MVLSKIIVKRAQTHLNSYNSGLIHCQNVENQVETNLKSYKTGLILT